MHANLARIADLMRNPRSGDNGNPIATSSDSEAVFEVHEVHDEICPRYPDPLDNLTPHHTTGSDDEVREKDWLAKQVDRSSDEPVTEENGLVAPTRLQVHRKRRRHPDSLVLVLIPLSSASKASS